MNARKRSGPTPEQSAEKFRAFDEQTDEGWRNPYVTVRVPDSALESQNEALRKAVERERTANRAVREKVNKADEGRRTAAVEHRAKIAAADYDRFLVRGMNQEELAAKLGYSVKAVREWRRRNGR